MGETVRTLVIIVAAIGVADVLDAVFYRHNWRWFVKGAIRLAIYPFLILANGKSVADSTLRVNRR